jgi:hypothetical protein
MTHDGNEDIEINPAGWMRFETAGSERMLIDSAGKISVGNNIPIWSGSYGGALFLKGNNATAARHAELTIVDSNGATIGTGLVVDTNRNVGIGTESPKATLDIKQASNDWEDGILLQHDNANTGWNIHAERTGSALWFGYNADTSVGIASQSATGLLYLRSTGRVGIGNSNPQDWLEIGVTGARGGLTLSSSNHDYPALSFARSSTATARIYIVEPAATHTSKLYFQTSDASGSAPNLTNCLRVTVGSAEENALFISIVEAYYD